VCCAVQTIVSAGGLFRRIARQWAAAVLAPHKKRHMCMGGGHLSQIHKKKVDVTRAKTQILVRRPNKSKSFEIAPPLELYHLVCIIFYNHSSVAGDFRSGPECAVLELDLARPPVAGPGPCRRASENEHLRVGPRHEIMETNNSPELYYYQPPGSP
jgi:hypothetical protein